MGVATVGEFQDWLLTRVERRARPKRGALVSRPSTASVAQQQSKRCRECAQAARHEEPSGKTKTR